MSPQSSSVYKNQSSSALFLLEGTADLELSLASCGVAQNCGAGGAEDHRGGVAEDGGAGRNTQHETGIMDQPKPVNRDKKCGSNKSSAKDNAGHQMRDNAASCMPPFCSSTLGKTLLCSLRYVHTMTRSKAHTALTLCSSQGT